MNRSKTLPFRETYFHLGNGGMFLTVTETRHQNAERRGGGGPSYRRAFGLTAEVRFFGVTLTKVQLPLASRAVVQWLVDTHSTTLQEMDPATGWQPEYTFANPILNKEDGTYTWEDRGSIPQVPPSEEEQAEDLHEKEALLKAARWLQARYKVGDWVCGPDEAQALAAAQRSEGGDSPAAPLDRVSRRSCSQAPDERWALEVIFARLLKLAAGPVYVDNVRTIDPYTEKARTEYRMTEQLLSLPVLIEAEFTAPSWD